MIEYDPHRWTDHLFQVRGSVLRQVAGRVLLFVAWSAVVAAVHLLVRPVGVPSTVHTLVGVALGLLLVFRTNASYDRFWEGRKAWGGIVNDARNLARTTSGYLAASPARADRILRWTATFPHACMHALRGRADLGGVAASLPGHEVAETLAAPHVPTAVARRVSDELAAAVRTGELAPVQAMHIDRHVAGLVDAVGACERIHRTPLPFAYMVHLRRALILYCATLPFALVEQFGWSTVLDTLMVTFVLFGIEEIGVEIEDPFGTDDNDLPLEAICAAIERQVLAMRPEGAVAVPPGAVRV
jgi:putative membrane protein